jgi:signal transduction histidine kinase/CheY-like chemotaxis protein
MNAELERLLGVNEAVSPTGSRPLITFNLIDATSRATRADVSDLVARAITTGDAGPIEAELTRADGAVVPVRLVATRLQRSGVYFVLTGVEDITAHRRLQAQVLHKHKMEAIGTLAGGVAHDFNNLLTSIMGNASLLARGLKQLPDKLKRVESIVLASERAAGLTAQLLSFSRRQVVQPRRLDVASVVRQSERLLERLLHDNVELVVHTEPTRHVRADEGQLSQVIMNLVLNARDAVDQSGVITLRLTSEGDGDAALAILEVVDDGAGMEEETKRRLFDPFFTTKTGGTGLGLSTVHDIVIGLGGAIQVESRPGEGTHFRIELPTCDPPRDAIPISDGKPLDQLDGVVVLVDDEPSVREVTAHSLSDAGLEVRTAENGLDALTLLDKLQREALPVALVVTDVVMPGMGGRELAERIRATYPDVPVVFMCGYTDDTILRHGIAADSLQLIRKPFTSDAFLRAVQAAATTDRD